MMRFPAARNALGAAARNAICRVRRHQDRR